MTSASNRLPSSSSPSVVRSAFSSSFFLLLPHPILTPCLWCSQTRMLSRVLSRTDTTTATATETTAATAASATAEEEKSPPAPAPPKPLTTPTEPMDPERKPEQSLRSLSSLGEVHRMSAASGMMSALPSMNMRNLRTKSQSHCHQLSERARVCRAGLELSCQTGKEMSRLPSSLRTARWRRGLNTSGLMDTSWLWFRWSSRSDSRPRNSYPWRFFSLLCPRRSTCRLASPPNVWLAILATWLSTRDRRLSRFLPTRIPGASSVRLFPSRCSAVASMGTTSGTRSNPPAEHRTTFSVQFWSLKHRHPGGHLDWQSQARKSQQRHCGRQRFSYGQRKCSSRTLATARSSPGARGPWEAAAAPGSAAPSSGTAHLTRSRSGTRGKSASVPARTLMRFSHCRWQSQTNGLPDRKKMGVSAGWIFFFMLCKL